jgi:hypothetical protein
VHWVRPQVIYTLSLDIRNKGDKLKDVELTNTLSAQATLNLEILMVPLQ